MAFTLVNSSIPFIATVEIECGFILAEGAKILPKTLFLDTHCAHCYRAIIDSTSDIFNQLPSCSGDINSYIISGALHYNMRFGNFIREGNLTTSSPNSVTNISSIQSICINNLIAYDCLDLTQKNDLIKKAYRFKPRFLMFKLYTGQNLLGIDLYSDINTNTLTDKAAEALNYATGCKTIVTSGYIDIEVDV